MTHSIDCHTRKYEYSFIRVLWSTLIPQELPWTYVTLNKLAMEIQKSALTNSFSKMIASSENVLEICFEMNIEHCFHCVLLLLWSINKDYMGTFVKFWSGMSDSLHGLHFQDFIAKVTMSKCKNIYFHFSYLKMSL